MTMKDGVCECCNQKKELVGVACIPGIPMSIAWCRDCLDAGAIPYWACVANTALCGGLEHTHEAWQEIVSISLRYHNKDMEAFILDVQKNMEEQV